MMQAYGPGMLVQLWLRVVVPAFATVVPAAEGLRSALLEEGAAAVGYGAAAVAVAAIAYGLDSRVPWRIEADPASLRLLRRWNPVTVPLNRIETIELGAWPAVLMTIQWSEGRAAVPRLQDEETFLRLFVEHSPLTSIRGD